MMWFFAILLVLVMGAIAMVASGRGTPMALEHDDRPDVSVPAGRLVGDDLRRVRFSLAFRGYRMSEVDALLDRLAVDGYRMAVATSKDEVAARLAALVAERLA